jgi:transcriptional regulator with XRE-family HTH domain
MSDERAQDLARFVQRVVAVRRFRGMSQHRLAELCGMPRTTLANIEVGRRKPQDIRLSEALAMADALEVPLTDLLGSTPLLVTRDVLAV